LDKGTVACQSDLLYAGSMESEEIELTFRLDAFGRTADIPRPDEEQPVATMDYSSKTCMVNFVAPNTNDCHFLDELLLDCEVADNGLMPRTFWVPSATEDFSPRCTLESMARDVFTHHTSGCAYDPGTSGAEWWVQIRPSPEAGRYSMHDKPHKRIGDGEQKDMSETGISFHWDKDEDLRLLCGGTTYIHPHLSTVTYLTSIGAPTLAVNCRVNNFTGEWIVPGNNVSSEHVQMEGFLSWPKAGKHLSFDGRFLHAAPPDLMEDGAFEKQINYVTKEGLDALEVNRVRRRHRRVTFLVNIWLNYRPFDVQPFPESMINKMSGSVVEVGSLSFKKEGVIDAAILEVPAENVKDTDRKRFVWPLGDCGSGETIRMSIPAEGVQRQYNKAGSVQINWHDNDHVCLHKEGYQREDEGKRQRTN
jgi:hypothetical protein